MHGMSAIRLASGLIRKLHDAAQFVPLPARRIVHSDPGFQDLRNLTLQVANPGNNPLLLLRRDPSLKPKRKHMNIHCSTSSISVHDLVVKPQKNEKADERKHRVSIGCSFVFTHQEPCARRDSVPRFSLPAMNSRSE